MEIEKQVSFNLRLPKALKEKAAEMAHANNRSLNKQINHLLENFVNAEASKNDDEEKLRSEYESEVLSDFDKRAQEKRTSALAA